MHMRVHICKTRLKPFDNTQSNCVLELIFRSIFAFFLLFSVFRSREHLRMSQCLKLILCFWDHAYDKMTWIAISSERRGSYDIGWTLTIWWRICKQSRLLRVIKNVARLELPHRYTRGQEMISYLLQWFRRVRVCCHSWQIYGVGNCRLLLRLKTYT